MVRTNITLMYLFSYLIYLYVWLLLCVECSHVISTTFSFLLGYCTHPFILFTLSVSYTFSDIFLSRDAKRVALIRFSFEAFILVDLCVIQLNHNSSDLVLT